MPKRNPLEDKARTRNEYAECRELYKKISRLRSASKVYIYTDYNRIWDVFYLRSFLLLLEEKILVKFRDNPPKLEFPDGRGLAAAVQSIQTGMSVDKCRKKLENGKH